MNQEQLKFDEVLLEKRNGAWIGEDAVIGNNVTILPGAVIGRPPISTSALTRRADKANLPPVSIGDNSVIGANVVIYRGTSIGKQCLLGDTACIREQVTLGDSSVIAMGVTVNYNTKIGSRVKVMDNTHLTGNMIIEDDVFIAMLVTTANDNSMGRKISTHSQKGVWHGQGPVIRRFVTIGQGTCILPGVEIGENSIIGANSVVTKSVTPRVLAFGVPTRVIRDLREHEIRL